MAKKFDQGRIVREGKKIGRNDPCFCGSGKKAKHCCGADTGNSWIDRPGMRIIVRRMK